MAASLIPRTGGSPIFLDKPIVLIGRHQDCDAVLQSSTKVSRRHCCVARINEQFIIRDLGSMNGVRVNGARINEILLHSGDEVAIGDQFFVVNLGEVAAVRGQATKPPNGRHHKPVSHSPRPEELSMEFPVVIPESSLGSEVPSDNIMPLVPEDEPILKDPMDDIQLKDLSDSEVGYMQRS